MKKDKIMVRKLMVHIPVLLPLSADIHQYYNY